MKGKSGYSLAIVLGIALGAFTALWIGNTWTGVLSGMLSSGILAWIFASDWSKAGEVSLKLASKISAENIETAVVSGCGSLAGWVSSVPLKFSAWLKKFDSLRHRKKVLAKWFIFLAVVLSFSFVMFGALLAMSLSDKSEGHLIAKTFECYFAMSIFCSMILTGIACLLALIDVPDCIRSWRKCRGNNFECLWYREMIADRHRGAFASLFHILWVRTGNVLKIIIFLLFWFPCAFLWLATRKTGACSLSAMVLSGVHLGYSHWLGGGINYANLNFWLAFAIAAITGLWIGKWIYRYKGDWKIPWPKYNPAHSIPLTTLEKRA